jgi:hypothetical protein
MAHHTTGYMAPNSEHSSESTTTAVLGPTKKAKTDTIPEAVAMPPQGGSHTGGVDTARASTALAATSTHVAQTNVYLNQTSSSSSVSVTSSAARQLRATMARAKRELAEARL